MRVSARWCEVLVFCVVGALFAPTEAHGQDRVTLCEREADAEQVFAYLQTAVEAGDRAGANACADAYLELAPRGAHVREANELVASMSERQAPDASQDHEAPAAAPERSQQYAYEERLPRRPRHFFSLSSGLQRQVFDGYGEADFGSRITIGGGGKISLVEERAYQLSVVVGHEGSLSYVSNYFGRGTHFLVDTSLNVGFQLDAAAGLPGFLLRVLYAPTLSAFSVPGTVSPDYFSLALASYQIVVGAQTERDWAISLSWAHAAHIWNSRTNFALSAQADFLF